MAESWVLPPTTASADGAQAVLYTSLIGLCALNTYTFTTYSDHNSCKGIDCCGTVWVVSPYGLLQMAGWPTAADPTPRCLWFLSHGCGPHQTQHLHRTNMCKAAIECMCRTLTYRGRGKGHVTWLLLLKKTRVLHATCHGVLLAGEVSETVVPLW